jgi:hypothetical protein
MPKAAKFPELNFRKLWFLGDTIMDPAVLH